MDKLQLDQHISKQFNEDLEALKSEMLAMGGVVEKQLGESIRALEAADSELAEKVLIIEDDVDEMERDIDEQCATLIARRQPAATDLRMVLVVSKSVRDLERIGDEAQKIAKMAIQLSGDAAPRGYLEVRHIADDAQAMLREALDAFMRYDADAAISTMAKDSRLDRDYSSALRELITYMMEDPRNISRALNVAWVLRSLERIGDHAKNICEHVVYLVKGTDIRHGHLEDLDQ